MSICHVTQLIMYTPVVLSLQDNVRLFHFSLLVITLFIIFLSYDFTWHIPGEKEHKKANVTDRYQVGLYPAEMFLSSALDRCTSIESFDFGVIEGLSQVFWFCSAGRCWTARWEWDSEAQSSCVWCLSEVRPSDKCRQWQACGMWMLWGGLPGRTTLQ